ncbi:MAG: MEDS domain-containing protein [Actinobacteria bacterium]|nr:MEDS domain-containing protein [Actinomycetota bacterium]
MSDGCTGCLPVGIRSVSDLQPGDHTCCIYENDEQHRDLLTSYMRVGLAENDKIIYIVDERADRVLIEYLEQKRVDPYPFLESGQLSFMTADEAYLRNGKFDPGEMIDLLRSEMGIALNEGYRALRVTGEMSWALKGLPGSERLIEYEARLNEFFPGSACMAICQYDGRIFNPEVLLSVLSTHPIAVIGDDFFDNFYYVPPEKYFSAERSKAVYEQWVTTLKTYNHACRGLEEREGELVDLLESSLEGVTTTSPEGRYVFANSAAASMLGYESPVQMIGRHASEHYGSSELRGKVITDLFEKGELRNYEATARKLDGTIFPVRLSSTYKEDADGNVESITTFFQDITEQKREEELKMMRALSEHVIAERERERKEVAREIHDEFGQALSCMKMDLSWLIKNLPPGKPEVAEKLEELSELTESSFGRMRDLVTRLRPAVLDRLGLAAALEWQLEDFRKHSGVDYAVKGDLDEALVDKKDEIVVFRIIKESLTNVARHSGADKVELSFEEAGGGYIFRVADNGRGISLTENDGTSMGILGMRERARGIGGILSIIGEEGKGTEVILKLPGRGGSG